MTSHVLSSHSATKEDGRAVRRTRDKRCFKPMPDMMRTRRFRSFGRRMQGVHTAYVKWYAQPDCAILVQADENRSGDFPARTLKRAELQRLLRNPAGGAEPFALKRERDAHRGGDALFRRHAAGGPLRLAAHRMKKADLLVVSAHCDDEFHLLWRNDSPTMQVSAALAVQIAYMANGDRVRVDEALNGLWHAGVRHAPVFFCRFQDVYTETLRHALLKMGARRRRRRRWLTLIRTFFSRRFIVHP